MGCQNGETHYPNMQMAEAATAGSTDFSVLRPITIGTFAGSKTAIQSGYMSSTKTKVHCVQCDMPEAQCDCERYCCLCYAQVDIRLCLDGLYYCLPCREACDYKTAD